MPSTNHTIIIYSALPQRLRARGWLFINVVGWCVVYGKRLGKYAHFVKLDYTSQCATFTRYARDDR